MKFFCSIRILHKYDLFHIVALSDLKIDQTNIQQIKVQAQHHI